jgi:hypothetical protein
VSAAVDAQFVKVGALRRVQSETKIIHAATKGPTASHDWRCQRLERIEIILERDEDIRVGETKAICESAHG